MESRCEMYESKCTALLWISTTHSNYSSASQIILAHVEIKIMFSPMMWKTYNVTNISFHSITLRPWRWKQQLCPKIYYSFTLLRGVNRQPVSYSLPQIPQAFIFTVLKSSKLRIYCPGKIKSWNSLLWESKCFITVALKTSTLHIHCPDNLKASYPLPWKPQIFKFSAPRI